MSYLSDNLAVLDNKNPSLVAALENMELPPAIRLAHSRSGLPTLQFHPPHGPMRFLHSADDPAREADRLCTNHFFKNEDATILFGFGLGYLAKSIWTLKEPHHLLCIVEHYPALLKLALEQVDLTGLLADENVFFFLGDAVARLAEGFGPLHFKALSGKIQKLSTPAFAALYREQAAGFERRLHARIDSARIDFYHSLNLQHLLLTNLFRNIPCLPESVNLGELSNTLRNQPAIVVAGGPSLDREMDTLRSCAGKIFIISSDTALKPLLQNHIIPDLVVTCDPIVLNDRKLDGLEEKRLAGLPLLFRVDAQPLVVGRFKRFKIMADAGSTISRWILNQGRKIEALASYQSVAHLAFLAARQMNADPIVLVGLDLSFPDGRDHASGTNAPWSIQCCRGLLRPYPGAGGQSVQTLESFISMIHIFEREISKTRARCINTSQNGALIKGMQYLPFQQVLQGLKTSNGATASDSFQARLRTAIDRLPLGLKEGYQRALQWFFAEAQSVETVRRQAAAGMSSSRHAPPAEPDRAMHQSSLFAFYRQAFEHRDFLNIISDCLPYYQLSFHQSHPQGLPVIAGGDSDQAFSQIRIFFEELAKVLPLLQDLAGQVLKP